MAYPTLTQIRAEICKKDLARFTKEAWHVVEPEYDLAWNWHIPAITDHLEAVTRQVIADPKDPGPKIQQLIVNIPPGHAKSIIVAVIWPAWEWLVHPTMRTLFASYALELAMRDSLRCRDLIKSEWYQEWFKPEWEIRGDADAKKLFQNTAGGFRQCLSVGSATTGYRGDKIVGDDLLSVMEAESDTKRREAGDFWLRAMPTRLNKRKTGARMLIQQRVHEADPTGLCLAKGGWEHLCLPSEFVPEKHCRTSIGFEDPRTEAGELLFEELFPREVLESDKVDMGSASYGAQHGQNPTPAGGLIFQRRWWRYWQPKGANFPPVEVRVGDNEIVYVYPEDLPDDLDEILQSWDLTFKDHKDTDFVAGGVWGRKGAKAYLLDRINARLSFTKTLTAIREMVRKWPKSGAILIEDKANGPAVINTLSDEIAGIIPVEPDGGKLARANAVTPGIESGNAYLPHPMLVDWIESYLAQHDGFPKAANDDDVDQTTQALRRIFARVSDSDWDC
ncbi:hypothetical protein EON81_14200 [bacterium]|nr:MAG: hypothetical protein EON81_14200 [bacterium]